MHENFDVLTGKARLLVEAKEVMIEQIEVKWKIFIDVLQIKISCLFTLVKQVIIAFNKTISSQKLCKFQIWLRTKNKLIFTRSEFWILKRSKLYTNIREGQVEFYNCLNELVVLFPWL